MSPKSHPRGWRFGDGMQGVKRFQITQSGRTESVTAEMRFEMLLLHLEPLRTPILLCYFLIRPLQPPLQAGPVRVQEQR
jgi:hypothetical protein